MIASALSALNHSPPLRIINRANINARFSYYLWGFRHWVNT